jgi:DNA-binding transcriptional LysR family regulator
METIDIRLLRALAAVYDARHVTRAAEALGLAQPTLSLALGRLRRQFGDPLFVRAGRGVAPTPRAEALIGPTRDLLRDFERLAQSRDAFDPATTTRVFRIAMTDASHATLLPRLLARVRRDAPLAQLEAARIDEGLAAALESGAVDLAIGHIPSLERGAHQQRLFTQDFVCLINRDHPRLTRGLTRADYRREAHVEIVGGAAAPLLEAALAAQGVMRRVALRLPGFLGLAAIIGATDLVATLPRQIGETLAASAGLALRPCPVPAPVYDVKQHWHARAHHDAANRWLRQLAAELFLQKAGRGRAAQR